MAGRGLKRVQNARQRGGVAVSPGLMAGRGLKQDYVGGPLDRIQCFARPHGRARIETTESRSVENRRMSVSPGLMAGRGLKH